MFIYVYIYIYVCVCVCVCNFTNLRLEWRWLYLDPLSVSEQAEITHSMPKPNLVWSQAPQSVFRFFRELGFFPLVAAVEVQMQHLTGRSIDPPLINAHYIFVLGSAP